MHIYLLADIVIIVLSFIPTDIETNGGIIGSTCLIADVDEIPLANESVRRHLQDNDPITNIQRITFLEFDTEGEKMAINDDLIGGPYFNGDKFNFDSASSQLNTSLPLADQTDKVPGGASLILYGETQSGKLQRNRIWWTYQLENCRRETDPVQVNDRVGWVTVSQVASAWPTFCKRAFGSPTIPPDGLIPPTLAPVNDIPESQSPSSSQGGGTSAPVAPGGSTLPPTPPTLAADQPTNPTGVGSTPAPTPNESKPTPTFPTFSSDPTLSSKPPELLGTSTPTKRPTGTRPTCVAYLFSKSSKLSQSKSSKSTKSCKSAKSNQSWGQPYSMNWDVKGKGNKEDTNRISSSRFKLNHFNYEPLTVDKMDSSNNKKSQSFAPAWELMAMFVVAAGLVGWTFRHELFLDESREVVATQQAIQGDIHDMSDDEEDIVDDVEEQGGDDEEEVSTSEDTEQIGDLVFNRTLQLINSDFDSDETGDGSVGFIDGETDDFEDQSPTQQVPEKSELESI